MDFATRAALVVAVMGMGGAPAACVGGAGRGAVATESRDGGAVEEPPLVAGPVETDADYARAIRAHSTKHEHVIPMRDGVKRFTSVYVPKDTSRAWPIMLRRTPYSVVPYGIENYPSDKAGGRTMRRFAPSAQFLRDGFVFAHQDVRGRNAS